MELFWAILVIATVVILLFAVLPSLVEDKRAMPMPRPPMQQVAPSAADPSGDMLAAHYVPARATVPEDFPRMPVGACPHTKPPSTDLPLRDIPLCVAQTSASMKLGQAAFV
jgi:hypothetical protein